MNRPRPRQNERPVNGPGRGDPFRPPTAQVLAILETISDTVITLDPAWRFTYLNRQALREARRPAEELLGRVIWEVYPELRGTPVEAHYQRAMRDQTPVPFETRGVLTGRWWEIKLYPSPTGLTVYGREVSERHQAAEALRASEERHRLITELTSDYTYTGRVEPDHTLVLDAVSDGFSRVTGYGSLDELNALGGWVRLVNPEDIADFVGRMQKVLGGERDDGEVQLRTRGGENRWVRFSAIPILGATPGRVVRIVGAIQDVTERRQAEAALRRLNRQHELILAAAGEGIYGLDLDGNTTFVNPAAARLLGWEVPDLIGRNMHSILHHSRPDGSAYPARECPIYGALRDGAVHRVSHEVFWRKDGTSFPVEYISTPLWEDGRLVGAVVTFTDTTARTQAERKLRDYADRLRTLSRRLLEVQEQERRHLARELHDEIGQFLTGLHLALERGLQLPAGEVRACLREGQRLVKTLTARVRDLSMRLRPAMLDDLGLQPALVWQLERYTAQTGVAVAFEHRGLERRFHPSEVETAAYRIVQEAVTNVARHAGIKQVIVRVWADRDRLCAQVEDHGFGFDPQAVLAAGASSGLAGMRERAALLGGRLIIDSAPAQGTRVTAELPVQGAEERSHRAVDTLLGR